MMCRCRPRTHHDNGGGVCVSFPGEGAIEMVNERGKKKAWAFDQVGAHVYVSVCSRFEGWGTRTTPRPRMRA